MATKQGWGEMIREARDAKGWTQPEWGERMDPPVATSTISEWEREARRPGLADVNPICESLGLSHEAFLMLMGIRLAVPPVAKIPHRRLVEILSEMTFDQLDALAKLFDPERARGLRQ